MPAARAWSTTSADERREGPIPGAPSLIRLLQAASQDRADLALGDFPADQIRWAVEAGLGPLLRRCTASDSHATTSPLWPLVQAADLTTRVLVGEQMDAMDEIVHACEEQVSPVTLLKGISICDQYYPEPHLRPMGDIDILVDEASIPTIESLMLGLGYLRDSEYPLAFYETHHHTTPLFHPRRGVWVEIHRGLFPSDSQVGSDRVFRLDNIRAELQPSAFRGRRVNRLSDDLQVVYLAAHWAFGFKRVRAIVGMLDVIRLLKKAPHLRWGRILEWLDGSTAASTYLYLMLTYLNRHRLVNIDPEILRGLGLQQRSLGPVTLKILHAVIDHYVVSGGEPGRLASARNFEIIWRALLSPGRPSQNLMLVLWNLLPSRAWFTRPFG